MPSAARALIAMTTGAGAGASMPKISDQPAGILAQQQSHRPPAQRHRLVPTPDGCDGRERWHRHSGRTPSRVGRDDRERRVGLVGLTGQLELKPEWRSPGPSSAVTVARPVAGVSRHDGVGRGNPQEHHQVGVASPALVRAERSSRRRDRG